MTVCSHSSSNRLVSSMEHEGMGTDVNILNIIKDTVVMVIPIIRMGHIPIIVLTTTTIIEVVHGQVEDNLHPLTTGEILIRTTRRHLVGMVHLRPPMTTIVMNMAVTPMLIVDITAAIAMGIIPGFVFAVLAFVRENIDYSSLHSRYEIGVSTFFDLEIIKDIGDVCST